MEKERVPRSGWYRTWPDTPDDGVYWRKGLKFGCVFPHSQGQWSWASWSTQGGAGLADSRQEAMALVERAADATRTSCSCYGSPRPPRPWIGISVSPIVPGVAVVAASVPPQFEMQLCWSGYTVDCCLFRDMVVLSNGPLRFSHARAYGRVSVKASATAELRRLCQSDDIVLNRQSWDVFGRKLVFIHVDGEPAGQLLLDDHLALA